MNHRTLAKEISTFLACQHSCVYRCRHGIELVNLPGAIDVICVPEALQQPDYLITAEVIIEAMELSDFIELFEIVQVRDLDFISQEQLYVFFLQGIAGITAFYHDLRMGGEPIRLVIQRQGNLFYSVTCPVIGFIDCLDACHPEPTWLSMYLLNIYPLLEERVMNMNN